MIVGHVPHVQRNSSKEAEATRGCTKEEVSHVGRVLASTVLASSAAAEAAVSADCVLSLSPCMRFQHAPGFALLRKCFFKRAGQQNQACRREETPAAVAGAGLLVLASLKTQRSLQAPEAIQVDAARTGQEAGTNVRDQGQPSAVDNSII